MSISTWAARTIRGGISDARKWGLRPTPLIDLNQKYHSESLYDRAWSHTHKKAWEGIRRNPPKTPSGISQPRPRN